MLLMAVFDQYLKKYKYYGFKKKKNKFFYTDFFFFASYMFMGLYWFLVIRWISVAFVFRLFIDNPI